MSRRDQRCGAAGGEDGKQDEEIDDGRKRATHDAGDARAAQLQRTLTPLSVSLDGTPSGTPEPNSRDDGADREDLRPPPTVTFAVAAPYDTTAVRVLGRAAITKAMAM
jgi:hypothetical protein